MSVDLRERIGALTVGELREIARNRGGAHDAEEVRAAEEELSSRFSVHQDSPLANDHGGDDSLPAGLKAILYFAWCWAVLEILGLAFVFSISLTANVSVRVLFEAVLQFGIPAAWAIWIAHTVRSEHRHARGILLSLLSLAVTVKITRAFLAQQLTYTNKIVLGILVVALCYVALSGAVRRHYRAVSSDADGR
jgi:hypothetical protein